MIENIEVGKTYRWENGQTLKVSYFDEQRVNYRVLTPKEDFGSVPTEIFCKRATLIE